MSVFGRLLGRHRGGASRPRRLEPGLLRRRTRWAEAWQTYPGAVGDAPALWSVDLGAVSAAPISHLPVRIDVVVPYAAQSDGLPTDWAQLATAEDHIRSAVAEHDGVYIGRLATKGRCTFTSHLPAQPATPVAVPEGDGLVEYDPHWAYVRDALAPDERQYRLLEDLAVVGVLAEHGDLLATPREVAHVAFFAEQAPAERAAADLRADGFVAGVERDDEGDFALTASRADPVAPPAVHELSWSVKETVERHGGTYDGWNCGLASAA
jgi:hypothetical protein